MRGKKEKRKKCGSKLPELIRRRINMSCSHQSACQHKHSQKSSVLKRNCYALVRLNIVVTLGCFVSLSFSHINSHSRPNSTLRTHLCLWAYLRGSRYRRARCDGLCHEIVVVARRTCCDIRVGASCPGVCTPTSDHSFLWLPWQQTKTHMFEEFPW